MLKLNICGILKKVGTAMPAAWLAVGEVNLKALKVPE